MIRRCQTIDDLGRQCFRPEDRHVGCDMRRHRIWCSDCAQVKPAPGLDLCSACGGRDAKPGQKYPPMPLYRGDQAKHDRIAKIRARAMVLREAGVLP